LIAQLMQQGGGGGYGAGGNMPIDPSAIQGVIQHLLGGAQPFAESRNPFGIRGPMPAQRFPAQGSPGQSDAATGGPMQGAGGVNWGGTIWGPGQGQLFANYLRSHGANPATWALAHPAAAKLLGILAPAVTNGPRQNV
jgi:hypothetical protein